MKVKFLLSSLSVVILNVHLHAISYDFNVGFGFGLNYNLRADPPDFATLELMDKKYDNPEKVQNVSQLTSASIGGFIGGGVSFPSTFGSPLTSSIGLEYAIKYFFNNQRYKYGFVSSSLARLDVTETKMGVVDNFLDVYYKIELMKRVPMDLQVNLGLTSRILVGTTVERDDAFEYLPKMSMKAEPKTPPLGLGLHLAMRYNVHMFFLGIDYSYIPSYHYSDDTTEELNTINGDGKTVSKLVSDWSPAKAGWDSAKNRGFNDHSISISFGVIFNKAILDSFMNL